MDAAKIAEQITQSAQLVLQGASPQARQEGQAVFENLQSGTPVSLLVEGCVVATGAQYAPEVQYYSLLAIEHIVKKRLDELAASQLVQLKNIVLSMVGRGVGSNSQYVMNKLAVVIVELAVELWPLQWDDFVPTLLSLASSGHKDSVLLILKTLCEEVIPTSEYSPDLPTSLVNSMRDDLEKHMSELMPLLVNAVSQIGIGVLAAYAEWIPIAVAKEHQLIVNLVKFIMFPETALEALEALRVVFGRLRRDQWPDSSETWVGILQLAMYVPQLFPASPLDGVDVLRKTAELWTAIAESSCFREMANLPLDVLNSPQGANAKQALEQYLAVLMTLTNHPAQIIAHEVCSVWMVLLPESSDPVDPPSLMKWWGGEILHPLRQVLLVRALRRGSPEDLGTPREVPDCYWSDDMFEGDNDDWLAFFSLFRYRLLQIWRGTVNFDPQGGLSLIAAQINQLLRSPVEEPTSALAWEVASLVLDHSLREVPSQALAPGSPISNIFLSLAPDITAYTPPDAKVRSKVIQTIVALIPWLKQIPTLAMASINSALTTVTFRGPGEQGVPLSSLSADTLETRRRASMATIRLASALSSATAETLRPLIERLQELVSTPGTLRLEEVSHVTEAMAAAAEALTNDQEYTTYLQSLLRPPCSTVVDDPEVQAMLSSPAALAQALNMTGPNAGTGIPADGPATRFLSSISLLHGLCRRVNVRSMATAAKAAALMDDGDALDNLLSGMKSVSFEAAASAGAGAFPSTPIAYAPVSAAVTEKVCSFIRSLHGLRVDPSLQVAPGFAALVSGYPEDLRTGFRRGRASGDEQTDPAYEEVRSWLNRSREHAYCTLHALCMASDLSLWENGRWASATEQASFIAGSIFTGIQALQDVHVRSVTRNILMPMIARLPLGVMQEVIPQLLSQFLPYMNERLKTKWASRGQVEDVNSAMALERVLRDVTRTYLDLLALLISGKTGAVIEVPEGRSLTPLQEWTLMQRESLQSYILIDPAGSAIAHACLTGLALAFRIPDTITLSRATMLASRVMRWMQHPVLMRSFALPTLLPAMLACLLSRSGTQGEQFKIMGLVGQIYGHASEQGTNDARALFLEFVRDPTELTQLDEALFAAAKATGEVAPNKSVYESKAVKKVWRSFWAKLFGSAKGTAAFKAAVGRATGQPVEEGKKKKKKDKPKQNWRDLTESLHNLYG